MPRAWQVDELGAPPDCLRLVDREVRVPGKYQVAIDTKAASLNFPDVLMCLGLYQFKPELPFTPGVEVAGVVTAVGEKVDPALVGKRVGAMAAVGHGGLTEQTLAESATTFVMPDDMPWADVASLALTYQTGWFGLHRRAHLQAGETLLVHAGAGGVGSAAIQLGVAAGARVIATAGGPDKVQVCRDLGAEIAIDYTSEDFVAVVKDATDGRGADVIYDPVGGDVTDKSRKCIAFEGRLVVLGFTSGRIPEIPANHVLIKNYTVHGLHWGLYVQHDPAAVAAAHAALLELYAQGAIKPLVTEELAFDQAPEALARLASRGTVGKLVVTL